MPIRRLLAVLVGLLVFTGTAAVASASPSEEAEFVALINQSRSGAGLAPLSVHNDLVIGARNHTAEMISAGNIFHSSSAQLSAVTTGWKVLGENVGRGPNPGVLHSAFLASPSHKANILGAFDRVGVGVAHDAGGKLYVTVIFMQSAAAPAPTTTTTAPPPPPPPPPPPATAPTTTIPTPAAGSEPATTPRRPSAPAVEREEVSPRTLRFEMFGDRWIEGTYCVVVRADGAICVE